MFPSDAAELIAKGFDTHARVLALCANVLHLQSLQLAADNIYRRANPVRMVARRQGPLQIELDLPFDEAAAIEFYWDLVTVVENFDSPPLAYEIPTIPATGVNPYPVQQWPFVQPSWAKLAAWSAIQIESFTLTRGQPDLVSLFFPPNAFFGNGKRRLEIRAEIPWNYPTYRCESNLFQGILTAIVTADPCEVVALADENDNVLIFANGTYLIEG